MGVSPMQQLRTAYEDLIDINQLTNKHNDLIKYFEKDLSGVLRYMFSGNIVP
jgi:hypothetical protein